MNKFLQLKFSRLLLILLLSCLANTYTWGQEVSVETKKPNTGSFVSETKEIKISTPDQLKKFREAVNNGGYYIVKSKLNQTTTITTYAKADTATVNLKDNIDLTEDNWAPIGDYNTITITGKNGVKTERIAIRSFQGTFNGNNHKITYKIDNQTTSNKSCALFRYIKGATINDLKVSANINVADSAAVICGIAFEGSTINNCHAEGTISDNSGQKAAAGICVVNKGTISNCTNSTQLSGSISGGWNRLNAGGIATTSTGKIEKCINNGYVRAQNYAGGICCEASGEISMCHNIGGVFVSAQNSTLKNGYANGGIIAITTIGPLEIRDCMSTGSLSTRIGGAQTKSDKAGGLVGIVNNANLTMSGYNCSKNEKLYGNISDNNKYANCQTMSDDDFKLGTVAYFMNGNSYENPKWRQNIGYDDYPSFDESKGIVYPFYAHGSDEIDAFSNDINNGHKHSNSESSHDDDYEYNANSKVLVCKTCKKELKPESVEFPVKVGDYYVIFTERQLKSVAINVNNGSEVKYGQGSKIRLANNIELKEAWTPIGDETHQFKGEFDGFGHAITNLQIDGQDKPYLGLFGNASETSYIHNLLVSRSDIKSAGNNGYRIGLICGNTNGRISDCQVSSSKISAPNGNYVGGIAGYAQTIDNCESNVSVEGANYVGGIVGSAGSVKNCLTTGFVSNQVYINGKKNTGGIVGECTGNVIDCRVDNIYVTVKDGGGDDFGVGGIAGMVNGLGGSKNIIKNCYSYDVRVKSLGSKTDIYIASPSTGNTRCYAGGIVGITNVDSLKHCEVRGEGYSNYDEYGNYAANLYNYNSIVYCEDIDTIKFGHHAGGLIGKAIKGKANTSLVTIEDCAVIKTEMSESSYSLVGKLETGVDAVRYCVYDVTRIDFDKKIGNNPDTQFKRWGYIGNGLYGRTDLNMYKDALLFDNYYTGDGGFATICLNNGISSATTTWTLDGKHPILRKGYDETIIYPYYEHGTDTYKTGGPLIGLHIKPNSEDNHDQYLTLNEGSTDHKCSKCGYVSSQNILYHADGTTEFCNNSNQRKGNDLIIIHGKSYDNYANCIEKDEDGKYKARLLALNDNSDFSLPFDITVNDFNYSATVKNNWSTLCMPVAFTEDNIRANCSNVTESFDVQLYTISSINDGILTLKQVESVVAGQPILVYIKDNTVRDHYTLEVNLLNANSVIEKNLLTRKNSLYGVFKKETREDSREYYLKNNSFTNIKDGDKFYVKPFHAYLGLYSGLSSLKSLRIAIDGEETIEDTVEEMANKSIEAIYNISGQRVTNLSNNGIYIIKYTDGTSTKVNIVK